MIDKFAKKEKCLYCKQTMEAKNRNKKFCSDKCRVYFGREIKKPLVVPIYSEIKENKTMPYSIGLKGLIALRKDLQDELLLVQKSLCLEIREIQSCIDLLSDI